MGQAEAPVFVDVLPMGSTAGFAAPAEISYGQISAGEGIALLWLIGAVCFLLAHVGIHVFHMRFLRAHSEIVCGGGQQALLEQIRKELHVRRNLPVWICGKVDSPMLTGLFHPTLILPRTEFSQEQRMFIFRHELAHYKRRDLWTKWVFLLAQSVHWFNPLVHILAKKANLDLENACDDTVLKGKDRLYRKAYGTVLLDVLTNQTHAVPAVHPFYREEGRNDRTLSKHDQHSSQKERVWISLLCFGGDGVAYQHAVSSAGPGGKRGGLLPAKSNAGGDCGNKGALGRMSKRLDV